MAFDTCLFAVAAPSADAAAAAQARLARVLTWFEHAGPASLDVVSDPQSGVVAGEISSGPSARSLQWGREGIGPGATLRVDGSAADLSTSPVDVTAAYRCGDAVSTHAVVAAVLGCGEARVRPGALAELLAFGHPANRDHVVDGVTALEAGAGWRIDGRGVRQLASPRAWALVAEQEAYAVAVDELHATLERWSAAAGSVALGLTAGRDSRVVAVALHALGIDARTYTWGAPASEDCREAARIARELGLAHELVDPPLLADAEVVATAERAVRWTEGAAPLGFIAGQSRLDADVNLTGAGGELGRAFHYAYLARNFRHPSLTQLAGVWRPQARLDPRVAPEARDAVATAARHALEQAAATGVSGWRTLDVVYAQQRMRRWGRSGIAPTSGAAYGPVFLEPQLAAALVSLPLEDRLTDGFHRRYLGERAPALVPPPPPRQRAGVPPVLRRAIARVRRDRRAPEPGTSTLLGAYPQTHEYLAGVARHGLVRDGLGEDWAGDLHAGVRACDARAIDAALTLAGPVTLADALAPAAT